MKRAITVAVVGLGIAAVALPAGAVAEPGGRSAVAKECAKLKKADRAAFRATFGPKHAMRHCIKGEPVDTSETTPAEFKNAAQECRAERKADPDAFRETWGTNRNKRNAMGKCVSSKVRDDGEEEPPAEPVA